MIDESALRSTLSLSSRSILDISAAEPTVASPSWWGGDSDRYRVDPCRDDATQKLYVKVMRPYTRNYVDWENSFTWAAAAGQKGIGPEVVDSDLDAGFLIMRDLAPNVSTATVDVFDGGAIEPLVELKKSVCDFPSAGRNMVVFDHIERLRSLITEGEGALPRDFDWMRRKLRPAVERINARGYDLVPCHGDGNVSNVMTLNNGSGFRLLDWDVAGMMDPLQDLGALLQELRPEDRQARPVFEMYWGKWDESLFDRCRIYGLADCVRWGLIGIYADQMNPGTHEYSKFADWQFLRARIGLSATTYAARVLNL